MSRYLGASSHLLISPRRITVIFITSDIITFLIQAAGGSFTISANNQKRIETGQHIFDAGLALQLASFAFFTLVYLRFLYRVRKYQPDVWAKDMGKKWYKNWLSLAAALVVSCIGILVSPLLSQSRKYACSKFPFLRFVLSIVQSSFPRASTAISVQPSGFSMHSTHFRSGLLSPSMYLSGPVASFHQRNYLPEERTRNAEAPIHALKRGALKRSSD
jgi:hypothetical protein